MNKKRKGYTFRCTWNLKICLWRFLFSAGIRLVGFPSGRSSRTSEEEEEKENLRRRTTGDTRTYRKW